MKCVFGQVESRESTLGRKHERGDTGFELVVDADLHRHPVPFSPEHERPAQGWFDRHGRSAVLVGRLVPGVRSLVSIPAGIARMPLLPFLGYTAVGSAAYNAVLVLLGLRLGRHWRSVETTATRSTTASTP